MLKRDSGSLVFALLCSSTLPVMRFVRGFILQNDVADFAEERIVQLVVVVHVLAEKLVTSKALTTVITLSFLSKENLFRSFHS